jgi:hypothetical protein
MAHDKTILHKNLCKKSIDMIREPIILGTEEKEMEKIIYTLIDDIHRTLEQGVELNDDVQAAIDEASNSIRYALMDAVRSGKEDRPNNLRMSMIGKPDRQIWYTLRDDKPEQIDGQTRIKFLQGHLLEAVIIALAKIAGHSVTEQQERHEVEGIKGHQDCRIDGTLVDIKTASSFGFKKFRDGADTLAGDDPFGYTAQISSYATAQNDEEVAFLAIDKSSCEMALCYLYKEHMIDAPKRISHLKKMVKQETPPERCYEPVADGQSGNMKLATGCNYCRFKMDCWSDVGLRAFQYSNGVRYFTHIEKEPNVEEIQL